MINPLKLRHLLFLPIAILTGVPTACSDEDKKAQAERELPEAVYGAIAGRTDTASLLNFTSGVRAIMEDSRGNVWFGSMQEGGAMYDGERFTYFDETNGLGDNMVSAIYEGSDGLIWFEGAKGVSRYDGQAVCKGVSSGNG
ncbi:two-component regulator propeller domain-containing protein [Roseivirga sp. BDSF3-8]|uniref:two-component regulator propeller domain-containing protein n=1 Tax=Roseivirga sp. BDSF3-8 TaxID=3241598 RepID=UPI0035324F19